VSDGIVSVTRSDSYWNSRSVVLDKIDFVSMPTAETALQAYRGGELDVVTNANFEPLALKILAPYEDFRTSVHSALNFYEFNVTTAPFSDRRVRLALAISVDREKLANAELGGSVEPAYSLLPLSESKEARYEYNVDAARSSLAAAGFPDGKGFPTVRLVVNRNNVQQRIASAVAKMWKSELNIETEIIVKDASEMRSLRESGDYHLIRRGVVLPSPSETASLMLIFDKYPDPINTLEPAHSSSAEPSPSISADRNNITPTPSPAEGNVITERSAIYDVHAIPLYFPRSYALVQPYVRGFDLNGIDSPDIGSLSIDSSW
jgi:oligopeptide transport system substrate-binding protein